MKNKSFVKKSRERFCPECEKKTKQVIKLYDPCNIESGKVWQCTICKEYISWFNIPTLQSLYQKK